MAKRATKDSVSQMAGGPDYEGALELIENRLREAKTAQGQASKKAATVWKDIEALGVNKTGAQLFNKIFNIEDDAELDDALRTFSKLCSAANISIESDMVDEAEGVKREIVPTHTPDGVFTKENYDEAMKEAGGDEPGKDKAPAAEKPKGGKAKAATVPAADAGASKPKLSIVTPDALN